MKRILTTFTLCLILFASNYVVADVIGLSGSTTRFGVATRLSDVSVSSIHGQSRKLTVVQPYNFVITDWLSHGASYWLEAYHASYRFKPSQTQVGQQIKKSGIRATIALNSFVSRYLQPWIGIGIDAAYSEFTKRHTIDFEGFRASQFDDESKLDLGLLINAHNTWNLSREWSAGVKGEYRVALSESIQGTSFEIFALYRTR